MEVFCGSTLLYFYSRITSSSSSPEGLYTILKYSEKVIINGGMCIFVITSVSVRFGILAQMKCLKVIKIQKHLIENIYGIRTIIAATLKMYCD